MLYLFKLRFVGERNMAFDTTVVEGVRYSRFKIAEKPEQINNPANAEPEHRYYGQAQWNYK